MNGLHYSILAYVIGLSLLWGYAVTLILRCRTLAKKSGAALKEA